MSELSHAPSLKNLSTIAFDPVGSGRSLSPDSEEGQVEHLASSNTPATPVTPIQHPPEYVPPPAYSIRRTMMGFMALHAGDFPDQVISIEDQEAAHMAGQTKQRTRENIKGWIQHKSSIPYPDFDEELWAPVPSPILPASEEMIPPAPDRTNDPDPVDNGGVYTPQYGKFDSCDPMRRNNNADIMKLVKFGVVQGRLRLKDTNAEYDALVDKMNRSEADHRATLRRFNKSLQKESNQKRGLERERDRLQEEVEQLQAANEQLTVERDTADAAYDHLNTMTWQQFKKRQESERRKQPAKAKKAAAPKKAAAAPKTAAASKKASQRKVPAKKVGVAAAAKPEGVVNGTRRSQRIANRP